MKINILEFSYWRQTNGRDSLIFWFERLILNIKIISKVLDFFNLIEEGEHLLINQRIISHGWRLAELIWRRWLFSESHHACFMLRWALCEFLRLEEVFFIRFFQITTDYAFCLLEVFVVVLVLVLHTCFLKSLAFFFWLSWQGFFSLLARWVFLKFSYMLYFFYVHFLQLFLHLVKVSLFLLVRLV